MKSDSLFYQIFQKLPELLGQLLGDTITDDYTFRSVEVKGLARRIDGLFLPPVDKPQHPLYFVEVQFQKDDRLYERLLTETFLYLGQYRPEKPWYCVALWSRQTLDQGVPIHYQTLQDAGLLKVMYLDQLPHQQTLGINLLHLIKAEVKHPLDLRSEIKHLRQQAQQLPSAGKIQDIINRANRQHHTLQISPTQPRGT